MTKHKNKFLKRKIWSSSASVILSLSLVLFVVGLLSLVLLNSQKLSNYVKENIGFTIMLKDSIPQVEEMTFRKELEAEPYTKKTKYISKQQATEKLMKDLGEDFVSFLEYSPLLASIDVKLNADFANTDSLEKITIKLSKNPVVYETYFQKDLLKKLNSNTKRLSFFLLIFSVLLFLIAFALINNTIRLSVYSKRFLIKTMGLVGATNNFIQKPFIIKSIYQGVYSSIFAVFMLIGAIKLIQKETLKILDVSDLKLIGIVFALMFLIGILLSMASTFFAVKKYIKLTDDQLYN
jgi:cell division transport system permease protein